MTTNIKGLIGKLNSTTRTALESAAGLCLSRTHYDIEIEHVLVTLLDTGPSDFQLIARHFGVDRNRLQSDLNRALDRLRAGNARTPALSPQLLRALSSAWLYGSLEYSAAKIRSGFVLVALLAEDDLCRMVRESSPELQKINEEQLRRDFAEIVRPSGENEVAPSPGEQEPRGGPRVFICYRREDSSFYADYLFACVRAEVPDVRVFRDSDTLKPGMVFSEAIAETVAACDIVLAIIGKKWLTAKEQSGTRRIDVADDWVKLEIATALQQKKLVIPCLVDRAKMPRKDMLPADLEGLALRQAVNLSQKDIQRDADALMERLRDWRR